MWKCWTVMHQSVLTKPDNYLATAKSPNEKLWGTIKHNLWQRKWVFITPCFEWVSKKPPFERAFYTKQSVSRRDKDVSGSTEQVGLKSCHRSSVVLIFLVTAKAYDRHHFPYPKMAYPSYHVDGSIFIQEDTTTKRFILEYRWSLRTMICSHPSL